MAMLPAWSCPFCTFDNHSSATACAMCGNRRHAEATSSTSGNVQRSQDEEEWTCSECTLRNSASAAACAACRGPRAVAIPARRSKKGETWRTANFLLGQQPSAPQRAAPVQTQRTWAQQRPLRKGEFVQGACRLILSKEGVGWRHALRVDVLGPETPACPICLDVPSVPRLTECGHAFCLLCALRHLETSRACPVCTANICQDDLRPAHFEVVKPPEVGATWRFLLLRREGSWIGLASAARHKSTASSMPREGNDAWHCARRVLANPGVRLDRLHAECRELETLAGDPLARAALERLRAQLVSATAALSEPDDRVATASSTSAAGTSSQPLVFYQSEDGQLLFFLPSVTKLLLAKHGCWGNLPNEIVLRVSRLRTETLSDELRRRHRFLDHLLGGEVSFVDGEVQVPGEEDRGASTPERCEVACDGATAWSSATWTAEWSEHDWESGGWQQTSWRSWDGWQQREDWNARGKGARGGRGSRRREGEKGREKVQRSHGHRQEEAAVEPLDAAAAHGEREGTVPKAVAEETETADRVAGEDVTVEDSW